MYIVEDRITPSVIGYVHGTRIKNRILRYWPKSGGAFDRLYMYRKDGGGPQNSTAHTAIYKLLNMDYKKDVQSQNYKGVQDAWIYLKSIPTNIDWSREELAFRLNLELEEGVEVKRYFEWSSDVSNIAAKDITNVDIVNEVRANTFSAVYTKADDSEHDCLAVALMDKDEDLFDITYTVKRRKISTTTRRSNNIGITTNRYSSLPTLNIQATIEISYTKKVDALDPSVTPLLDRVVSHVENFPEWSSKSSISGNIDALVHESAMSTSINKELYSLYLLDTPISASDAMYTVDGRLKVEYFRNLPVKDAGILFRKSIATDYSEIPAKWWERLIQVVITIAIIVVAFVTGQWYAIVSSTAWIGFLFAASIVLTLGAIAMGALAQYAASIGKSGLAQQIGGSVKFLGVISQVTGIIGAVLSFGKSYAATKAALAEASKIAISEVGVKEVLAEMAKNALAEATKTTAATMSTGLQYITQGYNLWMKYVEEPRRQEEIESKQEIIAEQEKQIEQEAGPELIDKINMVMEDPYYNIYENMSSIDTASMVHRMTEAKITDRFNKYYTA